MKNVLKSTLKKLIPDSILDQIRKYKIKQQIKAAYKYDYRRYVSYSDSLGSNTSTKLIGNIIKEYHVVEKGLTMPETRLGFGQELILRLIDHCLLYIRQYNDDDQQLQHAIQVVLEYEEFHTKENFILPEAIQSALDRLKKNISTELAPCQQIEMTKDEYFKFSNSSFFEFSNSRHSVRNYTEEEIPIERITKALELSQNTPSACNRQTWRTYIYTNANEIQQILEVQGGNRGFGHLTNKLIVVTADSALFGKDIERNQAYIDGGMYAMNLLYSLHYCQIAACILNCSNSPQKDLRLRKLCVIKESEVFIAMIACGTPPETFKIALSKRSSLKERNRIVY